MQVYGLVVGDLGDHLQRQAHPQSAVFEGESSLDDALKEIAESVGNLAPRIVRDALGYKRHSSIQLVDELCLLVLAVIEEKDVTRKAERLGDATFRDYKPAHDELELFQGHEDELGVKKDAGKECVMDGRTARDGCVEEHGDVAIAVGQIDHEAPCHGRTGHRGHLLLTGRKLEGERKQEENSRLMNIDRINELLQKGGIGRRVFSRVVTSIRNRPCRLEMELFTIIKRGGDDQHFYLFLFSTSRRKMKGLFSAGNGRHLSNSCLTRDAKQGWATFRKISLSKTLFSLAPG